MYEVLVGAAGHPHDFILYRATHWQICSLMRGYYRRSRPIFEAARIPAFLIGKTMGGVKCSTFDEFMPFSWELKDIAERQQRDYEASRRLLEQFQNEYAAKQAEGKPTA